MRLVLGAEGRRVVAQGDERRHPDRDRVGPERERLGDVGARADPAGDDELDAAMHAELLQRVDGEAHGRQRRDADVLDEDVLGGGGPALHAVEHDDVGARLDRERDVEVGARRADLDEDRLLPVGDLAQLLDLDLEVVGPRPVGVTARAALVDARRAGRASPRRDRRSSGRAGCRRRPAWRPGRSRSRSRPRAAGRRGSSRSARAAAGRRASSTPRAPRASCRRRRSSSRCPSRSRRGPAPPWPAPRARRSSCRRW